MKTVLRGIAGSVAGLFVSFLLVIAVEVLSGIVHPFPADFGGTMEEVCQHVERYPGWFLGVAVALWAGTALAGTWTAQRIGNVYSAAFVGLLLMAALVFNVSKLPYPIWFKIASLLAVPAGIVSGQRLGVRRGLTAQQELRPPG